jgi:hypothetical protein
MSSTLLSLQRQVETDNLTIQSLTNQMANLQDQLNDNITNLQNIANLNESTVVLVSLPRVEPYFEEWGNTFENAGYLWVRVFATADTTVEVTYSFQSLNYDNQVDAGTNGTAIFPILPSSLVTMEIGNSTTPNGTIANVTATYYY